MGFDWSVNNDFEMGQVSFFTLFLAAEGSVMVGRSDGMEGKKPARRW